MTAARSLLLSNSHPRRKVEPLDSRSIGEHFAQARRLHGISQHELAVALGVAENQACKFEKGYPCSEWVTVKLIALLLEKIESTNRDRRHHARALAKFLERTRQRVSEVLDRRVKTAARAEETSTQS